MSIFDKIEQFPFTIERECGDITETTDLELRLCFDTYRKLELIFNDNVRIGL